jgi:hypothetical protein
MTKIVGSSDRNQPEKRCKQAAEQRKAARSQRRHTQSRKRSEENTLKMDVKIAKNKGIRNSPIY